MKRLPPSAGRSWRSNHYLDSAEAIELLSKKREQFSELVRLVSHAAKLTRDPQELDQWHLLLNKQRVELKKSIEVVERLASRDDLVLLAMDTRGWQLLKTALRQANDELAKDLTDLDPRLRSSSSAQPPIR